jgi:general secretion pathway protein A
MILEHYKLVEQPFGVTPDPRFLYLSPTHREAMASVFYGVSVNRGFTALIARPGMGKTTILFDLLRKLKSSDRTVFLFQSQCGPRGLLRALLADLGIEDDGKDFLRMNSKLNEFLLRESAEGRRLIVVIDEAQNLSEPVLEVVRMLSNFETSREKLMHVILSGQPQLAQKLSLPSLVQLRQRVSIIARVEPFDVEQTRQYISHRLSIAGYSQSSPLFTDKAITLIARHSEGIPRTINNLCFNAMSLGYAMKQQKIDEKIILEVLNDLDLGKLGNQPLTIAPAVEATPTGLLPRPVLSAAPVKTGLPKDSRWIRRAAVVATVAALLAWPTMRAVMYAKHFLNSRTPAGVVLTTTPAPAPALVTSQVADTKPAPDPTFSLPALTISASPSVPVAAIPSVRPSEKPAPEAKSDAGVSASNPSNNVRISPNQTLFGISMLRYGQYNPGLVHQIVQLNPGLSDPNRIKSGQILRMPESPKPARNSSFVFTKDSNSAPHEVKEQ